MDAQARQALRSFATAPNAETARAALRAWRHGAAPPAVLRWALEVTTWDALDAELQTEVALAAARRQAGATRDAPAFVELRACAQGPIARQVAVYTWRGRELILIPAGRVELGQALDLTPRMRVEVELHASLSYFQLWVSGLRPVRAVDLAPFWIEAVPREEQGPDDPPDASSDAWEWASSGSARTLFRWGDDWPADQSPLEPGPFDEHLRPNAFGLRDLPADPNYLEASADASTTLISTPGGSRSILSWIMLAPAYGSPVAPDESAWFLPSTHRGVLELDLGEAASAG